MAERVRWGQLPPNLRRMIERETGAVIGSTGVPEGLNCSLALVLDSESGPLFLKGARANDPAQRTALRREAQIGPAVGALGVAPTVRHSVETREWHCLIFDYVAGTHADLSPGSADVAAVTSVLRSLDNTPAGASLPDFTDRFAGYLLPGEADALTGPCLLHTDTNPHNLLINDATGAAHLIDWAMPARGPSWIDQAYTAVRLMECGHTGADARAWLSEFTSWRRAQPRTVEAFVDVICRHWARAVGEKDAEPSNARFRSLLR